jgi:hypothetical protein
MVPHAPLVVAPPPVLMPDWETLGDLLSDEASRQISIRVTRRPPSVSFVAQLINWGLLDFEAQTKKPSRRF